MGTSPDLPGLRGERRWCAGGALLDWQNVSTVAGGRVRDPARIWDAALGELRLGMSQANFDSYLAGTSATAFEDDELTVVVTNPLVRETLEQRFRQHIHR